MISHAELLPFPPPPVSLLLEESDEEGDLCRICQMAEESPSNPLIAPCRCTGSLQYVHQDCMKKWLISKISSGKGLAGAPVQSGGRGPGPVSDCNCDSRFCPGHHHHV